MFILVISNIGCYVVASCQTVGRDVQNLIVTEAVGVFLRYSI